MSSKSPRGLMLKLLVSYYSAPSTQAPRPWCSPIGQGDDDLGPVRSSYGHTAWTSQRRRQVDGRFVRGPGMVLRVWKRAGRRMHTVHRGVCTRVSSQSAHGSRPGTKRTDTTTTTAAAAAASPRSCSMTFPPRLPGGPSTVRVHRP